MPVKTNAHRARVSTAIGLTLTALGGGAAAQSKPAQSPASKLDTPFASFRAGVIPSPFSIDGGLDVTFPRVSIGPNWTTRADLDLSARFHSPSFGSRRDAEVAVSLCGVYTPGGVNRGRFFAGGGPGLSFGPQSGLYGKLFVGVNFTQVISLEVEAQFSPTEGTRGVLMLRLAAL